MIINIEELEQSKDGEIFVDFEGENKELETPNLLKVSLTVKKIAFAINIKGKITGWVEKICDRCLKNFKFDVNIKVDETLSLKPLFDYSNKEIRLEEGQFEDEILNSDELDIDNFIYQTVTLNFPNKIVCDINCNGSIEIKKEEFIQDPRLEIFNKLKKDK